MRKDSECDGGRPARYGYKGRGQRGVVVPRAWRHAAALLGQTATRRLPVLRSGYRRDKRDHGVLETENRPRRIKDESELKMNDLEKEPRHTQIIIRIIAAIVLPFYLMWTFCRICSVYAHVILLVGRNAYLSDKLERNRLKINVRYEGLLRKTQSQKEGEKK